MANFCKKPVSNHPDNWYATVQIYSKWNLIIRVKLCLVIYLTLVGFLQIPDFAIYIPHIHFQKFSSFLTTQLFLRLVHYVLCRGLHLAPHCFGSNISVESYIGFLSSIHSLVSKLKNGNGNKYINSSRTLFMPSVENTTIIEFMLANTRTYKVSRPQ